MKNELRELTFTNGATTIVKGYEYAQELSTNNILEELTGWDDFNNVIVETAEALSKPGSYIIGTHIGEREVVARFQTHSNTDVKEVLNRVKAQMLTFQEITMARVYKDATGAEKRKEVLNGIITSVGWERKLTNASIIITIKCSNPLKTVYLNGSLIPETGGQL